MAEKQLIEDYDLEVESVPCKPGSDEFGAIVRLDVNIGPALPYLNRVLRGAVYVAQAPCLTWKKGGRNIAFWSYKIAIGHLEDRTQAQRVAQGLVDLVNRTWARREEIKPDYEMRKRPGPLETYKLLPQTNCRACGQPTCYIFAVKLVMGHVRLEDCLALQEPRYTPQLSQLVDMLSVDVPAVGPKEPLSLD
jgi:ArsR family metal-binding transcriptional regulator